MIGELLQAKRCELNMEIAQISDYLKVKASDIEAIEKEDWQSVTRHLYKPGLIKSYAKMLRIDAELIEEQMRQLPFESNIKNKKYQLVNIGEEDELTPNKDMFFNFLLICGLMFLILLSLYNSSESKKRVLSNRDIIDQMQKIEM